MTAEAQAREKIDAQLRAAGWTIQDGKSINLGASLGIAVREFPGRTGPADYALFIDGKVAGIIEAKPEGTTLSGVADQAARYQANTSIACMGCSWNVLITIRKPPTDATSYSTRLPKHPMNARAQLRRNGNLGTLQASLRRVECLRQSILERAFRGELVPQDPNDELAEALLKLLKSVAASAVPARRPGRPRKLASL